MSLKVITSLNSSYGRTCSLIVVLAYFWREKLQLCTLVQIILGLFAAAFL